MQFKNRKAHFNYTVIETYEAGIQLMGSEVKSLRAGKISFVDSFCYILNKEMYLKKLNIAVWDGAGTYGHESTRERKLLLHKKEMIRIDAKMKEKGLTLVPLQIYTNDRGLFKLEIGLCKGKKTYDKRDSIKEKDIKRELDRNKW